MADNVYASNETVTCTIIAAGAAIPSTYELLTVDTFHEVNRIPVATIVLLDGTAVQQEFAISNSKTFGLGEKIEIRARYEGKPSDDESLFKGIVVRHAVEANSRGSQLTITLKSQAIRLVRGRKHRIFSEQSDSAILKSIAQDSDMSIGTIDNTSGEHKEMVQFGATDWDFALSRAEANGLAITINNEKFSARMPKVTGKSAATYDFGISDIYSFEIEADGEHQYKTLQTASWALQEQRLSRKANTKAVNSAQGNWKSADIAEALGNEELEVSYSVPLEREELQAWATAVQVRSSLSLVRGTLVAAANGKLALLDKIELRGIGDRFNGPTLVTGVRHSIDQNGWQTAVQFGFPADTFTQQHNIHAPSASSLLPDVQGLLIGLAGQFNEDPAGQFQIQVELPLMPDDNNLIWARVLMPDAGKDRGTVSLPQPGDEVIVGFLNNDPRHAIVLGSLFSSSNAPPADLAGAWSEKNELKGFVSKSGFNVVLLDKIKPSYTIESPASNTLFISDEKEAIMLSDQHGNYITLDKNGITLESAKNMTFKSSGKLQLQAESDITIKGRKVDIA